MNYISLLALLGPSNILEDFDQRNFLHPSFFRHCFSRPQFTTILQTYQNNVLEMDIFLPDSSIDLIYTYRNLLCPRKSFYVYCQTEATLREYQRMPLWNRYDFVFNINVLHQKLERRAQHHLLYRTEYLENRKEEGDADAADLLIAMGEILEQNATRINEEIRQKSCLSLPAAEFEEG